MFRDLMAHSPQVSSFLSPSCQFSAVICLSISGRCVTIRQRCRISLRGFFLTDRFVLVTQTDHFLFFSPNCVVASSFMLSCVPSFAPTPGSPTSLTLDRDTFLTFASHRVKFLLRARFDLERIHQRQASRPKQQSCQRPRTGTYAYGASPL